MAIHFNGLYPRKAKSERKSAKNREKNAILTPFIVKNHQIDEKLKVVEIAN